MYARPHEHTGEFVHAEIKECEDEISMCVEEDWFHQLSCNPASELSCNPASDLRAAEHFIMEPVGAE